MAQTTFEQDNKTVYVSNISPSATEKTVSDFFSFCGKISKLFLNKEKGTAVIQFETESAAKTALLLTNALIVDRPITVSQVAEASSAAPKPTAETTNLNVNTNPDYGTQIDPENITQRNFGVPDEERTKTSVVASLVAAGYVLASDAIDKAKEYDDKHSITAQAKVVIEQVKTKAQEIDQQYRISETAVALKNAALDKAKELDVTYGLTDKANQAAFAVKTSANAVAQKLQENPTVSSGVDTIKTTATLFTSAVDSTYKDVKDQTQKAIEEKQRERGKFVEPTSNAPANVETQSTEVSSSTTTTNANPPKESLL